jgi:2-polyprenyl-6-methoxyphenol hydroxylase-like FAD-dependent oxidoreductase
LSLFRLCHRLPIFEAMVVDTEVLVVGAGPVGLTLALDLARRGVHVTVAESRAAGEEPKGRSNVASARTMETFRRLGVAHDVRDAGLPAEYPNDVAFRTNAVGIELGRIPIPARARRFTAKGGPDTWWPTPEPPHRINQRYLEPVLLAAAKNTPGVRILNRTRISGFTQHDDRISVVAADLDGGSTREIRAHYLAGCDGAHSAVRRALNIALQGDRELLSAQSTYIRAPALLGMMPSPAWAVDCIDPRSRGLVFAIDGRERWAVHRFAELAEGFPESDRAQSVRDVLGVPPSFSFDILEQEDWVGRRMIAERFRDRRVFLCGDAAHVWMPFAAYGMNAGIADAANLSWMLAGVIKGWAHPSLLDAYDIERRPVDEQVSRHAASIAKTWINRCGPIPEDLEMATPRGRALCASIGQRAYNVGVGGSCCAGLNFGYCYEDSPIIVQDGEPAPPYTLYEFRQSTVPGCRTPHFWLPDGRSLYDALGPDFTLMRFDRNIDVDTLVVAARRRSLPITVLDLEADQSQSPYSRKLLLSRPDQHVAWRGDAPPDDALGLIDRVRGVTAASPGP